MSSYQRIIFESDISDEGFKAVFPLDALGIPGLRSIEQYFTQLQGGLQSYLSLRVLVGATRATGTFTFSSTGPTNGQTCTIAGVTFTAVTSGATGNQFNISATPATVAANFATTVNRSTNLTGIAIATALLNVVTIFIVVPGAIGNGIPAAAGTLSNTVVVTPAGGTEGTRYIF